MSVYLHNLHYGQFVSAHTTNVSAWQYICHHGAPGRESAYVCHAGDDEGGTGEPEQGIGGESPGKDQVNQA